MLENSRSRVPEITTVECAVLVALIIIVVLAAISTLSNRGGQSESSSRIAVADLRPAIYRKLAEKAETLSSNATSAASVRNDLSALILKLRKEEIEGDSERVKAAREMHSDKALALLKELIEELAPSAEAQEKEDPQTARLIARALRREFRRLQSEP